MFRPGGLHGESVIGKSVVNLERCFSTGFGAKSDDSLLHSGAVLGDDDDEPVSADGQSFSVGEEEPEEKGCCVVS